ncbi:MAG TPA: BMP family ABC transporter substrate-binding protein, partial [Erysipelothrix sp.]|nr:BMP family ABC transporter substrate-binding protein [Erysipelothrix sp.]
DTVITSAMKNLQGSVYNAVKAAIEGGFEGGKLLTLGVEADGVQLPNDFSKFETFTEADYNAIYETLQNDVDGVTSGIPTLFTHGDLVSALSFDNVTIEAIGE